MLNCDDKLQRLRCFISMLTLACLVLFAGTGATRASATCDTAAQLLDGVASTTHKLHAAAAAHDPGAADAIAATGLDQLSSTEFSTMLTGPSGRNARTAHATFIGMYKRFASLIATKDWQAASQLIATDMAPTLPRLVDAVSHNLHCDLQGLYRQMQSPAALKIAGSAPSPDARPKERPGTHSSASGGSDGLGQLLGSGYASIALLSLVACSTLGLMLYDRNDRRKGPRHNIHFDTLMEHAGIRHHVRVLNIGPGGAKFTPNPGLTVDDDITITINGESMAASVRWHCETFAGIAFAERLCDEQISQLATE